jgi:hypothetical protein
MSERLVIDVGRVGDQFFCQLSGKQHEGIPFDITAATARAGVDVKTAGAQIFEELCKNREVRKAIEGVLKANGSQPIYINATAIPAQGVRWEALWSASAPPPGFVSLDRRWPVARIAGTDTTRIPKRFVEPLRILAVISAEGRPGEPEWLALYDAATGARDSVPVQIHVLTGEAPLYQKLKGHPANCVSVAPVPNSVDRLGIEIGRFGPHILHFFCHGHVDAGNAYLDIHGNLEPLQVSISNLTQLSGLENVWLVVLNSCLGAASLGSSPSMAYRIVSDGKVPFAIGATETVDVRDAITFSRAFYDRLLFTFGDGIKKASANSVLTLEWSDALYAARAAINKTYDNKASTCPQWTLPILYEHRTRLQLIKPDAQEPDAAAALHLKMAAELLAALPPDTSDATKKGLVAAILN